MIAGAMLDRLLHRSVVLNIDGDSYRMRSHRARAEAARRASAGQSPVPDQMRRWLPEHGLSSAQAPSPPQVAWGISVIDSGEFRKSAAAPPLGPPVTALLPVKLPPGRQRPSWRWQWHSGRSVCTRSKK